jgi:hypothetical protein
MPSGKNWINFLYVNITFVLYVIAVFYIGKIAEIKKNWPLYRCNPVFMPLANNVTTNFTYCIQKIQSNYMSYLLQPLSFLTSTLTDTLGSVVDQVNDVRGMFSNIRFFIPNIFTNIFNMFSGLIIEFEKIAISLKDVVGKTTGIVATIMYMLEGSITTIQAGYNAITTMGIGKCFHPDTLIELKNGKIKKMKDLDLGDILKNGSIVESVMKINNKDNLIPLYVIKNKGVNNENIYVTGSHYVYDKESSQFIKIENYKNAQMANLKTEWFSCLITSDHNIHIGNEVFWDWDDYLIKIKYKQ